MSEQNISPEVQEAMDRLGAVPHYCDDSCANIAEFIPNPAAYTKGQDEPGTTVPDTIRNPDYHVIGDKEVDHAQWHLAMATQVCRATHMMLTVPCDTCMQRVEQETGHPIEFRYERMDSAPAVEELSDADRHTDDVDIDEEP